jgi:hypothetical protein
VHDTVVAPSGNVEPDAGAQTTGRAPDTASWAVTTKLTTAPTAEVASTVMPAGTVRTGGVLSVGGDGATHANAKSPTDAIATTRPERRTYRMALPSWPRHEAHRHARALFERHAVVLAF